MAAAKKPLLSVELRFEQDTVVARQRARQIARALGFDAQDQTRIATAVSEIGRNAFKYAGGGRIEFILSTAPLSLAIVVSDNGHGIAGLASVLGGTYRSPTGLGLGIVGARRLVDTFDIDSVLGRGTIVRLAKHLPPARRGRDLAELATEIAEVLARERPGSPLEEMQQQNQELLHTLEEIRTQKEELVQLNRELEDTNRGVIALLAELDEKADYLARANEVKSRFLSNMTHEFRTPLNSILSLTRLLGEQVDGPLAPEQALQVRYIEQSAEALSEIVNDLLDLAKVEAGKIRVKPMEFRVADLFAALRGMLRPLLAQNTSVSLVFEDVSDLPPLYTDESKVSQILRNLISNALKYTERGEVRVSARLEPGSQMVFAVSDTGIGIAPEDQQRIFEEFNQLDSPLHQRVKGTGLGLPLSRKLTTLLGGTVRVDSSPGLGSMFYAIIPVRYGGAREVSFVPEVGRKIDPKRAPVLVVEDNREALFIYEKYLRHSGYQVLPARTLREAREWLDAVRPAAVVLDILLEGESTWGLLRELREDPATRRIPVLVVTVVENERRAFAMGADAFAVKPVARDWLVSKLDELTGRPHAPMLLIVDDDEIARYLLRGLLSSFACKIVESKSGPEGLVCAREQQPSAILLDLNMPGMDGFEVLSRLQEDPSVAGIPVIIYSGRTLDDAERQRLSGAIAILHKDSVSREAAVASLQTALQMAGLRLHAEMSSREISNV